MSLTRIRAEWLSNIRGDLLAGMVVALALIPEAIAFSIIAGVDPKVGLYASFCISVVIAIVGGRAGMISAATGAMGDAGERSRAGIFAGCYGVDGHHPDCGGCVAIRLTFTICFPLSGYGLC